MNIVMICRLYAPHIGGVEKHVAGISREAVKEGNRVEIFTLKHESKLPTEEIIDGMKIHRITEHKLSFPSAGSGQALLRMIGRIYERIQIWLQLLLKISVFFRSDVIHIHDVFYWYWPIRILLPWKKVYITFHGFEAGSMPTAKAKRTRQMITRWTQGNIAVGAWIEKWYGTKADVVTYGAGDCIVKSIIQPTGQAGSHRTTKNKKLACVFIGRIAEDTGANIYKKVIGTLPNVTLDIFGEGSPQGVITDSCTVFPRYYIACVSSYLSIVEAMQSKVLVVAYAADKLKYDYLMSHPRAKDIYIVRSEEELKETILSFVSQPTNQNKLVEAAYEWAKQQTWHRVYEKYTKLWNLT